MEDVSVSVRGDEHDAGAAEEHGGALDTAHCLAQPALDIDIKMRAGALKCFFATDLYDRIIAPPFTLNFYI